EKKKKTHRPKNGCQREPPYRLCTIGPEVTSLRLRGADDRDRGNRATARRRDESRRRRRRALVFSTLCGFGVRLGVNWRYLEVFAIPSRYVDVLSFLSFYA
ncbi:unnamed protein product, partial [Ixodes pacificus]